MKRLLLIILFIPYLLTAQTVYHVGAGGDYTTIAQVNAASFSAGDSILFKRGQTWREQLVVPSSGTAGAYIGFGAYGTGANPQIIGSNTTTWDDQGGGIWKSASIFTNPRVSDNVDLYFNASGVITWGTFVANTGLLNAEYKWTWASNYIYVYAASDPDARYTSVEVPQRISCVNLNNKDYISFDSIDIHYATYGYGNGVTPENEHIGLKIEHSKISYIGGNINSLTYEVGYGIKPVYSDLVIRNNEIFECGRRAVDLHIYGLGFTLENLLIEDNIIHDCYHTTGVDLSVGSSGYYTASIDGVIIRRNIMYNTANRSGYTSEELFIQNSNSGIAGALIKNIYVYANIFKHPDNSSIHIEHGDSIYIYNNTFYEVNTTKTTNCFLINIDYTSTDITIKNNIFYSENTNNYAGLPVYVNTNSSAAEVTLDYNIYYRVNNSVAVVKFGSTNYYMNQLATLRSAGYETHGQFANPTFTSSSNYNLQAGSTAIGAGIGVGVTKDYVGNNYGYPNVGDAPSLGAYEYDATGEDPAPPELPTIAINTTTGIKSVVATFSGTSAGTSITDRGFCWATTINPSLSGTHVHVGTGAGTFTSTEGLTTGTTYHLRSFATNSEGTVYSEDVSFTTPVYTQLKTTKPLRVGTKILVIK